jgi:hypothetical protein
MVTGGALRMTITIPHDLEVRLRSEAARQGVEPERYATRLLAERLAPPQEGQSLADLFAQWTAEDHTDDPAELARRNEEFEEFKRAMNRNRRESEGPSARKIYPDVP